ncbi:MAG: class I mannose-6-phosphate isomerase [Flavobacteriaceae bacterium]|nr:class I mannose-6-phosphate isomerase [Bacteroidia bacterium]NNF74205.1 class I mannose-6-phosphate isomerase [Flavobacteriaceae bacterium]
MIKNLHPLKFTPILQERIWGGEKLRTELNKPVDKPNIGESWEISDVKGYSSIVQEGALTGKSLRELIETYKSDLLGKQNFQRFDGKFPILIKFIDAKTDLSIQLHPDDELAKKRHDSFGKTEMWHVMHADKGSRLILGLKKGVDAKTYLEHLEDKTLPGILNEVSVSKGDTFFIEAGLIHAIGGGIMLAEIQQTSDVTYRVYDWDRVDAEGNSRELHNDLALDAIDFEGKENVEVDYERTPDKINEMVNCPFFKTNYLQLTENYHKTNTEDSFLIYICLDGQVEIESSHGAISFKRGESVLIPACIENFNILTGKAELLEVYV